jgi:hypothetical protein
MKRKGFFCTWVEGKGVVELLVQAYTIGRNGIRQLFVHDKKG